LVLSPLQVSDPATRTATHSLDTKREDQVMSGPGGEVRQAVGKQAEQYFVREFHAGQGAIKGRHIRS
jgi:hypothetical protein